MTEEEYLEKGKFIWQNYVPKSGQSEFIQGELLRAAVKLRDESHRNGNGNWDKGHEILANYILNTINESEVLDLAGEQQLNADINRILNFENPYLEDDLFDRLEKYVIDYFVKNPKPIPHTKNINLHR
jgi:hypothetical protein